MPYRIAKSVVIESGHLLSKHSGDCRFPHGHSRTVEVIVTAEQLDRQEMVCDFQFLKSAIVAAVGRYDHAFLINAADPRAEVWREAYGDRIVALAEGDPTTELLARIVFDTVRERLTAACAGRESSPAAGLRVERVRITETASSWAEYWE
jgi:6-pyruvoyltetrahydropterin/6-carboxytetrahydropterin synthase